MAIVAGDVRATMTMDTSVFSEGVAQARAELHTLEADGNKITNAFGVVESGLGASATAIAEAMRRAGVGSQSLTELAGRVDYANEKVLSLSGRAEEARTALEAAQAAARQSADALTLLEESAQASADNLQWAREQLDNLGKSGTATSGQLVRAKDTVAEFEAEVADLNAQLEKQQASNTKNQSTAKRASDRYQSLALQLSGAEKAADKANGRFDALVQTLAGNDSFSLSGLVDTIGSLGSSTLTSASRSLSNIAVNAAGLSTSTTAGALATHGLSEAVDGLLKGLGGTSTLMLAGAGAALYGAYQLYDYASGARAAREAQERLNETAQSWAETDIVTSYEKSAGMGAFGLDEEDFLGLIRPARGWMEELVRIWSDGKKETDEIAQGMIDGWTSETDTLRTGLGSIKATAVSGGYVGDGFLTGLDTDLERLDEIDKATEKLLKKRKNGMLSDRDFKTLESLQDERKEISIKYGLEPSENSGFEQIAQNVESALSRGADPATVWADSYAAATQGIAAYTDALNAEYDAQYANIQLLNDTAVGTDGLTDRQRALGELQTWYNEQSATSVEAYNNALAKSLELTDVFGKGGAYEDTSEQLQNVYDLMNKVATNPGDEKVAAELSNALAGLDETQVVEITSALVSMQAAAEQSGTTLGEGAQKALDAIQNIKTALGTGVFEGNLKESLETMFGENLDSEVLQVYTALNYESLESSYAAWAQGEHADILPTIETETLKADLEAGLVGYKLGVNGQLMKVDPTTGKLEDTGYRMDVDGNLYKVDPTTGKLSFAGYRIDVDGRLQKVDPATGKISDTDYRFGVDGQIAKVDPETGVISDTGYRIGVDGRIQEVDPTTGELTDAGYRIGVDGKVEKVDPETGAISDTGYRIGVNGEVSLVDPTTGELSDTEYRASVPGQISSLVEAPGLKKPVIVLDGEVEVKKVNVQGGEFTNSLNPELEYSASKGKMQEGGGGWATTSDIEQLNRYADAINGYNDALAAGNQSLASYYTAEINRLSESIVPFVEAGSGFDGVAQHIANGLQLLQDGQLTEQDAAGLRSTIENLITLMQAPESGAAGQALAEGIAGGLRSYGWDTDAATVSAAIQTALDVACGINSPAELTKPTGTGISEGVAEGMKDTSSIAAAASTVAGSVSTSLLLAFAGIDASMHGQTAVSSYLSAFADTGDATVAGEGLGSAAADGLGNTSSLFRTAGNNAGSAFVRELRGHVSAAAAAATAIGTAAYNALKASLSIHSPSRKMRELGAYTGEGYALGISDQITMTENSIRRLAGSTMRAAADVSNNNYHNAININLNGVTMRSDEDVRRLSRQLGRYISDANFALT